jgi:hypothetical protein
MSLTSARFKRRAAALNLAKVYIGFRAGEPDVWHDANGKVGSQRHYAVDRRVDIEHFHSCRIVARKERIIDLAVVQDFPRRISKPSIRAR